MTLKRFVTLDDRQGKLAVALGFKQGVPGA